MTALRRPLASVAAALVLVALSAPPPPACAQAAPPATLATAGARSGRIRVAAVRARRRPITSLRIRRGLRHLKQVLLHSMPGHLLVTRAGRRETDVLARLQTGRVWDVDNTITLYRTGGEAVFRRAHVEYAPRAVSANGRTIVCLMGPPEHWEGPPEHHRVSPATDSLVVLSRSGEETMRIEEPPTAVDNVRLSRSGRWLAYRVTPSGERSEEVRLVDLEGREVTTLAVDPAGLLASYTRVSDRGDLVTFVEDTAGAPGTITRRAQTLYRRPR
jgi:hypothetical protein